jgi:hypothetical protein
VIARIHLASLSFAGSIVERASTEEVTTMSATEETRQLAFRLPQSLIGRLEHCEKQIQTTGLNLSRTELVKLLLSFALDTSACDITMLLGGSIDGSRRGNKTRRTKT